MKKELLVNLNNLLLSLSEVVDIANPMVAQHQQRTAFIALEIATVANAEPKVIENIFSAALLHDIGAVTVEEKAAIHNFTEPSLQRHAIRGALLLEQIPWLEKLSDIVRTHHTPWNEWKESINSPVAFSSQVVSLADYVERLIDRNKYILHQNKDIISAITSLPDTFISKSVVSYFLETSRREEFWLDLVSPRLYTSLLNNGPFGRIQIGLDDIALISNLYRDLIDFKSRYTATHTSGVSECAVLLSKLLGFAPIDMKSMMIAGNFHDIGKFIIPSSILEKPTGLTIDEFAIMRCHTYYTYNTLDSIGGLQRIAEWAAYHHEKLNGNGYPFHCTNEEIGTGSRIMAVSDIFTAILEDRPYRKGMNRDEIFRILKRNVEENALDKNIVELLLDNYDTINQKVRAQQTKAFDFYEKRFLSITNNSPIL